MPKPPDSPIRMIADLHTHTPLCKHAEGRPVDYARQAQALGLDEIGFSDHNPMPEWFDDWRMTLDELPTYLDWIAEARAALPSFPIRQALECDYLAGRESWIEKTAQLADWDYLIGSVHYIHDGVAVDDPQHVSRWTSPSDVEFMWDHYFRLYEQMIRTQLFDFHAHPDLAKRFGRSPSGDLKRYYEPVLQALVDTGGAIEINTAGLRKDLGQMYPSEQMLALAHGAGVPILINSDAHRPEDVGADFTDALSLAHKVGYTQAVRFEKRQRRTVALPDAWQSPCR